MKRKYSISLGIGAVGSAAYLGLIVWYVLNLLQGTQTGIPATVEDLPLNLILHICLMAIGAGFTWTAFFSGIFTVAVAASICFTFGAFMFYHYLLFSAPLIILTLIGSFFCHKLQMKKQEKEAEMEYNQKKVSQEKKKPKAESTHVKRTQPQRNTRQEMLARRMQHNQSMQVRQENTGMMTQSYVQPVQQSFYTQMQDPYAPLAQTAVMQPIMQPIAFQPAVYPYPVYNGEQGVQQPLQTSYQPVPMVQNPAFPQAAVNPLQNPYPQLNQPMAAFPPGVMPDGTPANLPTQPHAGHTRPEGYFDDYGNFHPGSEQ